MMKVVHLSHHDTRGGAAKAAYRLHRAMLDSGVDSLMCVSVKHSEDPTVLEIKRRPPLTSGKLGQYLRAGIIRASFARYRSRLPMDFEIFSDDRSPYGKRLLEQIPPAQIFNLHWVAGFLDQGASLPGLCTLAPVVWRLSDMNPFTGGCHYNGDCRRFEEKCGSCPQLGSGDPEDLSRGIWKRKNEAMKHLETARLRIIALNRWMAKEVGKSPLFRDLDVTVIPNGVDAEKFGVTDKASSRRALGVPEDARIVLFVADKIQNPRKGLAFLGEALREMENTKGLFLLTLGSLKEDLKVNIPQRHLGYQEGLMDLTAAYSSADVYVHPAVQDNQPNTVLEAMACGVPVVAFDTGGLPEIVLDGETGFLAAKGDLRELARNIRLVLLDPDRAADAGRAARRRVEKCFTRQVQVDKYLSVYAEMITRDTGKG